MWNFTRTNQELQAESKEIANNMEELEQYQRSNNLEKRATNRGRRANNSDADRRENRGSNKRDGY